MMDSLFRWLDSQLSGTPSNRSGIVSANRLSSIKMSAKDGTRILRILLMICCLSLARGCGYPGAPSHSLVTFSTETIGVDTVATYECEGGFELLGPVRRVCGDNGTWTPQAIPFCVLNVATGKAPMQSSISSGGFPQKGVDGSTSAFFAENTCTQTEIERAPWWYVNLLEPYMIQLVRIDFGRPCCANNQPATIVVRVGNNRPDLAANPICGRYSGFLEEGRPLFIPCSATLPGAFVSIHMETPRGGILSICEAFVYTDQALPIESCPSIRGQPLGSTATYNGKCYVFHNTQPLSFESARRLCMAQGGSLVDETSPALQGFLSWELWRRHRTDEQGQYWMGAVRDPRDPNNWRWLSGRDVTVSFWNLPGGTDNCTRFDGTKGWLWSDTDCNLNLNYICQYRPTRCGIPERPPNSTILTTDDFTAGTMVEYLCSPGHIIIGSSSRTCLPNGFYTESVPSCKYLECGSPVDIVNGHYTLLNGTRYFGSVVRYACEAGHILMGVESMSCDAHQTWNGPPPRCEPTRCAQPAPISNGSFRLLNNTTAFGTVLEYVCDHPGYKLHGPAKLRCGTDGEWDNEPPSCIEVIRVGDDIASGGGPSIAPPSPSPPRQQQQQRPTQQSTGTSPTPAHSRPAVVTRTPSPPSRATRPPPPAPTKPLGSDTGLRRPQRPLRPPQQQQQQTPARPTIDDDVASAAPPPSGNALPDDGTTATPAHFIRPYFPDQSLPDTERADHDLPNNEDQDAAVIDEEQPDENRFGDQDHQQGNQQQQPPTPQAPLAPYRPPVRPVTPVATRPLPTVANTIPLNPLPSNFDAQPPTNIFNEPLVPPQRRPTPSRPQQPPPAPKQSPTTLRTTTTTTTTTTARPRPTTTTTVSTSTTTSRRPVLLVRSSTTTTPVVVTFRPTHPDGNRSVFPSRATSSGVPSGTPPFSRRPTAPVSNPTGTSNAGTVRVPEQPGSVDPATTGHGARPPSQQPPNQPGVHRQPSDANRNDAGTDPRANVPDSEIREQDGRSNTRLNLGGIIALSVFGGFVVLAAFTTIVVILCRRSRRTNGSLDNTTISTDDSLSSESRGLNRYYKRAWDNLRSDGHGGKSAGGLHRMAGSAVGGNNDKRQQQHHHHHHSNTTSSSQHATISRRETLDAPNYRTGTGSTIEGLRDTNEMTVDDATAWNTAGRGGRSTAGRSSHHHHHHHHHRRSGSPDSIDGRTDDGLTWNGKSRRH